MIAELAALIQGERTAAATADRISELITRQVQISESCTCLWSLVLAAATEIADPKTETITDKLAGFLVSLQRKTAVSNCTNDNAFVEDTEGEFDWTSKPIRPGESIEWGGMGLWRDLPGFSRLLSEYWNGKSAANLQAVECSADPAAGPYGFKQQLSRESSASRRSPVDMWTSLNALVAKLVASSQGGDCLLSYATFGILSMRMTFETEHADEGLLESVLVWLQTSREELLREASSDCSGSDPQQCLTWLQLQGLLHRLIQSQNISEADRQLAWKCADLME